MEKGWELSCLPLFSVSLCSHIADTGHKRAHEARYRAEASRQAGWQLREVGWRDAGRSLIMEDVIYSEHSSRVRKQTIRWNFILITFYDVILRAPGWPACVAACGWGRLLFSAREKWTKTFMTIKNTKRNEKIPKWHVSSFWCRGNYFIPCRALV